MKYVTKLSALITLTAAALSTASTIDLRHNGYGAVGSVKFNYDRQHETTSAGVLALDKSDGTGTIFGFCMDILQYSSSRYSTYDVILPEDGPHPFGPMGDQKADNLRELWGRFFDEAWTGKGPFTSAQNNAAETFQACVWKIIYDDLPTAQQPYNITSGKFSVDNTTINARLANSWLQALNGTGPKADLRCLTSNTNQDFLVAVPEPAAILVMVSAIPMMFWRKGWLK